MRSNTARGIYKLDGKVPKSVMSGETSNTSQFCDFEWFEWVMFQDEMALYLDDYFKLARCLVLSIDFGPAMTAKIIKYNDQVLHRSMYQALTQ